MDQETARRMLEEHIDVLADIEHDRWAHWQRYMHGKAERHDDGSLTIPAELASQWERQIETAFADLSDKEKESDREQVRKYIPVVAQLLSTRIG